TVVRRSQGPGGDVGRGRGRGVERVVARVGATDADPAHRDRLGGADVLVRERGGGVAIGEHVAANAVIRQGHRGSGAAIVDLVHAVGSDGQGPGGDVGHGAGRGVGRVLALVFDVSLPASVPEIEIPLTETVLPVPTFLSENSALV